MVVPYAPRSSILYGDMRISFRKCIVLKNGYARNGVDFFFMKLRKKPAEIFDYRLLCPGLVCGHDAGFERNRPVKVLKIDHHSVKLRALNKSEEFFHDPDFPG